MNITHAQYQAYNKRFTWIHWLQSCCRTLSGGLGSTNACVLFGWCSGAPTRTCDKQCVRRGVFDCYCQHAQMNVLTDACILGCERPALEPVPCSCATSTTPSPLLHCDRVLANIVIPLSLAIKMTEVSQTHAVYVRRGIGTWQKCKTHAVVFTTRRKVARQKILC